MITLLSRFFIKNRTDYSAPETRQAYGLLCGSVGILLNILLFTGKFIAGMISNSIAITADAFNNLSDAGSSLITLIGFKMSGKKPDLDHPFGHGRIEYLSGLLVSISIILMAFELLRSSFAKVLHPTPTDSSPLILCILVASILVKLYMHYYNRRTSRLIDSAAMRATAVDSLSDSIATTVVLLSTLIGKYTHLMIDGYCGVLVGLFILFAGYKAAKETLSPLLGQPPTKEFVSQIESIVMSDPSVCGMHDLIVHDYGPGRVMISLHAEVPSNRNILEIHDAIDNIEVRLKKELHCDATIHMDPILVDDPVVANLKKQVAAIIASHKEIVSFHDFRIVKGPTHTNLVFDILLPMDCQTSEAEVLHNLRADVQAQIGKNYYCVIQVDRSYAL